MACLVCWHHTKAECLHRPCRWRPDASQGPALNTRPQGSWQRWGIRPAARAPSPLSPHASSCAIESRHRVIQPLFRASSWLSSLLLRDSALDTRSASGSPPNPLRVYYSQPTLSALETSRQQLESFRLPLEPNCDFDRGLQLHRQAPLASKRDSARARSPAASPTWLPTATFSPHGQSLAPHVLR